MTVLADRRTQFRWAAGTAHGTAGFDDIVGREVRVHGAFVGKARLHASRVIIGRMKALSVP